MQAGMEGLLYKRIDSGKKTELRVSEELTLNGGMQMHKLVKTILVSSVLAMGVVAPATVQVAMAQVVAGQPLSGALLAAYQALPAKQQVRMLANLNALSPAQLAAVVALPPAQAAAIATLGRAQVQAVASLPAAQLQAIAVAVAAVEGAANADAALSAMTRLSTALAASGLPASVTQSVTVGVATNVAELADAGLVPSAAAATVLTTAVASLPANDPRVAALESAATAATAGRPTETAIGAIGNDASPS
jgi:hypothetical protein